MSYFSRRVSEEKVLLLTKKTRIFKVKLRSIRSVRFYTNVYVCKLTRLNLYIYMLYLYIIYINLYAKNVRRKCRCTDNVIFQLRWIKKTFLYARKNGQKRMKT